MTLKFLNTPNLLGILKQYKREIMNSINCVSIGWIYDVKIEGNKRMCNVKLYFDVNNIKYDPDFNARPFGFVGKNNYPVLYDCIILGEHFQSPIKEGDECLVLFNDKCLDYWYETGKRAVPATGRSHSLSDGLVILEIGNMVNSSYIKPDGYEPPENLPEICDCPIPKYGYQERYTRLRADSGDISIGDTDAEQRGITLCARDYSSIRMYAEGSAGDNTAGNIEMHPTNSLKVTSDNINFILHGDSDTGYDPRNESSGVDNPPIDENIKGKLTLYKADSDSVKVIQPDPLKPDNWWAGKKVYTTDMYRIMAKCKDCFSEASSLLRSLGANTDALEGAIDDFITRYYGLFSPADPIEEN